MFLRSFRITKLPFTKFEKVSIALSLFIIVLGYVIAIFTCADVFARFGALVVCVGVYFASKGFSLNASKISEVAGEIWEANENPILAIIESEESKIPKEFQADAKAKLLAQSKELKVKADRKAYALEMRLIKVESNIIMVGTLIWAFGDYLVPEIFSLIAQC
ncbi:MAG: hypothetical protein ACJAXS_000940 [Colwellia sp.]|jgi:hypothetical protein